ncbi:centromere protein J [Salarias fasciatus]|uniref:Centromere protein J n=1 Tax=Salarias fasciatus TaxID=181472 RepID=A0A672GVA4_SALFA|nr:centromere protein J [Salarias fasciatus]
MSSPAELHHLPADFLARWMPSSTRAGVILDPSSDLAGTLRHVPAVGSPNLQPDDSFTSDFAPLPPSVDSSCLGGVQTGTDRSVNGLFATPTGSNGEYDSLGVMEDEQDLPLMMKLEQLRKWQQHMQEQLKAHQLEELLRLQEEQQRLLINGNGSQHRKEDAAESSETSEPEWVEDTLHGTQQAEELSSAERQRQLSTVQGAAEEEDLWNSGDDPETVKAVFHPLTQHDKSVETLNEVLHDRPIKPGIGVQKRTFEELLEEQLRLEEQRLQVSKQQTREGAEAVQAAPKRTFLKRGEGLARFTKNTKGSSQTTEKGPKPQPQARVISRSNSEPTSILTVNAQNVPRLPVQRKTAILNKENRPRGLSVPPADSRTARTKVLGGRQQQNTCGPESSRTDSEGKTRKPLPGQNRKTVGPVRSLAQITQPNPVTKQVGVLESQGKAAGSDAARNRSLGSKVTKNRENPVEEENMPSDCFELSFQERIQRWECDRQQESMDLGEFELLEQAAEELSFSSNSSFVVKVLQMDQQRWLAAKGLHQRRLSSTPVKFPPRAALERCSSAGDSGASACLSSSATPEASAEQTRPDELKRGISCDDKDEQNREKDDRQQLSDISSCCGSESGDEEAAVGFPAQANPPYDKRSYQDEDVFRDPAPDEEEEESNDSTLMEDEDGGSGRVVFDDDDTWNDLEDTAIGPDQDVREDPPVSPPEKLLVRKVAASRGAELHQEAGGLEPDLPPASQLMSRLFPALKPKPQKAPPPPPPAVTSADKTRAEDPGQQAQSLQLRERLAELEIEIERFKKENSALTKLRQENEKIQENLRRERAEFEQTKAEEAAKFEEYKKEENKKLQKERKLFETHVLATRALPDRKEREEMQALKQQLNSAQEELKRREARWTSTHSRLRQQIDSLSQENSALRDEVRMLEKLRLSAWKKTPAATERESPRVFENTVSAVTKGVTFASPLDSRGSSSSSPPQPGGAAGTRRPSRETSQATAGRKSSLRKPAGPGSSSSSLPSRRTEEKSAQPNKSLEKQPEQEQPLQATNRDPPPNEPGCRDVKELEAAKEVITHPDGKVEKVLASGDRVIVFPNGTRKEVSADGESVKVTFFNGDTKQITADQRVTYYYAEAQTTHITYPDGLEVLHFPNNQTEKHFPDGRKEITFPDQTVKNLFPDGREESVLTDGTIIQVNPDGTKEIHFNTGQKEIHTADYKRRQYPDGTVKTVYTDGRQETRYPTGRVRIKDQDGNVVLDQMA